jgi:hypothetical protein
MKQLKHWKASLLNALGMLGWKLEDTAGENHTLAIVGWCAVAVAVVLIAFTLIPGLYEDFANAIFDRLEDGLGI